MKINDYLSKLIFNHFVKNNPAMKLYLSNNEYEPEPIEQDFDADKKAYQVELWVYRCCNVIAENLTSSPLVTEQKKTEAGEEQWVASTNKGLNHLFQHPNPNETIEYLLEQWVIDLCTVGNGYLVNPKDAKNELWNLPAEHTKIKYDKATGIIEGYQVKRYGKDITLEPEEVIHVKLPNPYNVIYGMSPVEAIKMPILINYYNRRHIKNYFKKGGIPAAVLTTDQPIDFENDENLKRYKKEWQQKFGEGGKDGQVAFLGQGFDFKTVTPPLKDLIIEYLTKMTREEIAAVWGVPPLLLGILDDANRANSKDQTRLFWDTVIDPYQRRISSALNKLISILFGEQYRVRFDNSKQEALQEDQDKKMTRIVRGYKGGLLKLNEARERLGLEWVEDGDDFAAAQSELTSINDDKSMKVKSLGDKLHEAHEKKLDHFEVKVEKVIAKYWDGQIERVIAQLKGVTLEGKFMAAIGIDLLTKGDAEKPADAIFNLEDENKTLRIAMTPVANQVINEAARSALEDYGIDAVFDMKNPEYAVIRERFLNRSERINGTTYQNVKNTLKEAYDEGIGIDETERRLRDLFKEYYKVKPGDPNAITRGRRFARTEMNGMVNGASMTAHKQAGVTQKKWLASRDPDTRPEHLYADGEVVGMNEPFIKTGEPLMFPGDPGGSAGNVINCRCTYVPKLD